MHPRQLFGIETNEYAHEPASAVVWIGYLQWKHRNAFDMTGESPILQPLDNIRLADAILDFGAAKKLDTLREGWLNPSSDDINPSELRRRTLTNLYNDPPTWLRLAHERLDEAVSAAYGWPADLTDGEIIARLLELNLEREAVG